MTDDIIHVSFYPSDWLAGTRGLTPAETGVYITLVAMMYERQEPLSFDCARLARMCNCPAGTFRKILAVLLAEKKILETPAGIWNERVETEIRSAREAMKAASERGRNAVNARWAAVKPQSDDAENAAVKPQSDEQKSRSNTPKNPNEISDSEIHEYYVSNTNQNQSQNIDDGDGSACARDPVPKPASDADPPAVRERILAAIGIGQEGVVGPGKFIGSRADMAEAQRWLALPGMTLEAVEAEIASIMRRKPDGPPHRFSYFTGALQRLSAALSAQPLTPAAPSGHGHRPAAAQPAINENVLRLLAEKIAADDELDRRNAR